MKKNSVRWAKKQWALVERLLDTRNDEAALAESMERSLLGVPDYQLVPIDKFGRPRMEDAMPGICSYGITVGVDDTQHIKLQGTNQSCASSYIMTAVAVYVDGHYYISTKLSAPIQTTYGAVVRLSVQIINEQ